MCVCVCRHLFPYPWLYVVVVGEHNITKMESTQTTHELEKIYVHPEYNNVTNNNDLALLKMKKRIRFTREVSPVCLPDSDDPLNYYDCMVTGWGKSNGECFLLASMHVRLSALIKLEMAKCLTGIFDGEYHWGI